MQMGTTLCMQMVFAFDSHGTGVRSEMPDDSISTWSKPATPGSKQRYLLAAASSPSGDGHLQPPKVPP